MFKMHWKCSSTHLQRVENALQRKNASTLSLLFPNRVTIEVSVLNLSKKDRCCTDEVYVVDFVPCYKGPNKRTCALDLFLEPLVRDLEDSFMQGTKVKYRTYSATSRSRL